MISAKCPRCSQALELSDEFYGKTLNCPTCRHEISIPRVQTPPAVVPRWVQPTMIGLAFFAAAAVLTAMTYRSEISRLKNVAARIEKQNAELWTIDDLIQRECVVEAHRECIRKNEVRIGMGKLPVILSWGPPLRKQETRDGYVLTARWHYKSAVLIFENDFLARMESDTAISIDRSSLQH